MSVPISRRFFGDTLTLDASDTVQSLMAQQSPRAADGRVVVAHGRNTLAEVIKLFKRQGLHHLPVLEDDGQKVIGIVSATDVLNLLVDSPLADFEDTWVSDIMTPEPECVLGDTSIRIAAAILSQSEFRCLPVVSESGEIYGIVTTRDIVRYLDARYREV